MSEIIPIFNDETEGGDFVDTPTAKAIFDAATWCHQHSQLGLIVGNPGIGKTMALRRFVERTQDAEMVTMAPARKTMTAALGHVCCQLGGFPVARLSEVHDGLVRMLGFRGVRLLIIDEAQHLSDYVIDEFRCIYDETGTAIILCGNSVLRDRVNNERRAFGQVTSRIGTRLVLSRPSQGDVWAVCDSRGIVDRKSRAFLFEHSQSSGALRNVQNIANAGIKLSGSPKAVRVEHLKQAVINLIGGQ